MPFALLTMHVAYAALTLSNCPHSPHSPHSFKVPLTHPTLATHALSIYAQPRQRLDLYLPEGLAKGAHYPVVIFVTGGRFFSFLRAPCWLFTTPCSRWPLASPCCYSIGQSTLRLEVALQPEMFGMVDLLPSHNPRDLLDRCAPSLWVSLCFWVSLCSCAMCTMD